MKKIIVLAAVTFVLANILAGLGLLIYGFATGRLDAEQREQYLATWRGEKLVSPPDEEEIQEEQETPQQASMRITAAEEEREILTREMQRHEELLRNMQDTINTAKAKLEKDLKQLEKDKRIFAGKVEQQEAMAKEEGFQKALKSYILIKPKYAKADFMEMDETEAVRFLAAMKADTATKILNQFKTPQEQEKRRQLLKLLEEHKVISLNESSKG